jgi:predicted AAA+ superfamily ATPase
MSYKPRVFDKLLQRKLAGMGAVLIEGPKWCGKTTTAEQLARSKVYMNDPKKESFYVQLAQMSPETLLSGDVPRLIDEWQVAPSLWDAIRFQVDHRDGEGFFILTGSSVPAKLDKNMHSGTGRIARMQMYPMSFWESGDSNGLVSLADLFAGKAAPCANEELSIQDLAYLTCRGGWPKATTQDKEIALDRAFDYYDAVTSRDIKRVDGVDRNTERAKRIMRSYARFQGSQTSISKIAQDIQGNESGEISHGTVDDYISALRKLFVIEDMPAWNPNLRSKTAIRTSDTRYFIDPSIAVAALGAGPDDLINDLETFGLLFETLCVRDLRVYASVLNGTVYHYRDKNGLECDAVLHLRNGSYGLIEIKLGGQKLIDEGAETLKELANKIDDTRMAKPSFMMVLTGLAPFAFQRPDGVWVVPINALKP